VSAAEPPDRRGARCGASAPGELAYHDELSAAEGVDYLPTVSRPDEGRSRGWTGRTGRVDGLAVAEAAALAPDETRVYACGNPGMIDAVKAALEPKGVAVATESFA